MPWILLTCATYDMVIFDRSKGTQCKSGCKYDNYQKKCYYSRWWRPNSGRPSMEFRATSHTRLKACDRYTSSTLIGGQGGAAPSSPSHYDVWGTNGVRECKMDVKVYVDSYMASNGSCFMVTWIVLKNHVLEVGLTQNQETMALWTLTTVDLFYFIMCEGPHE